MPVAAPPERILVIRTGALGDLVFCFQSFHEIRQAHPGAEIALLTRKGFAGFAGLMPWFDRVIIDTHPKAMQILEWWRLTGEINQFAPTRIYDLQGKTRQTVLYALLDGPWGPEWSGAAPGCKFPRVWPPTPDTHFTDFLAAQLRAAGVPAAGPANLDWLNAPVTKFVLPPYYTVIVPGCSPSAPYKRWPAAKFADLARRIRAQGRECVAVGTRADQEAIDVLKAEAPALIDLCGKDTLPELAGIFRGAQAVVGGDTGPVHLAAAVGAPTLALFSGRSKPIWAKPPGAKVLVRQSDTLDNLSVDEVVKALDLLPKRDAL
ncbi:MAG: glycosyltransferase family 9 protein [Alphaproteobacteria bacterium]|nr:glycosyltransferase family 9 protein [Alphaproteobacteria bacterium]